MKTVKFNQKENLEINEAKREILEEFESIGDRFGRDTLLNALAKIQKHAAKEFKKEFGEGK